MHFSPKKSISPNQKLQKTNARILRSYPNIAQNNSTCRYTHSAKIVQAFFVVRIYIYGTSVFFSNKDQTCYWMTCWCVLFHSTSRPWLVVDRTIIPCNSLNNNITIFNYAIITLPQPVSFIDLILKITYCKCNKKHKLSLHGTVWHSLRMNTTKSKNCSKK